MGNAPRIISNTFYLFLDWLVLTLGGYLFWVIMGKMLSPDEIGHFSTVFSISMFLVGFAGLGINIGVTKLFPYYQKKNRNKEIVGTLWWSIKTTALSSMIFGIGLLLLNPIISKVVPIGIKDSVLVFFMLLATTLMYVTNGYLYGAQKIRFLFLSDIVLSLSKVIVMLPLIVLGYNYLGPVYGVLFASAATLCIRYGVLPKGKGTVEKKKIWFYSIPVLASTAGVILINQGSIVILSALSTAASVGLFSLMFFLSSPVRMIPQLISSGTFPVTAQESDNMDLINRIFFYGTRYSLVLTLPIVVSFILFSEKIVLLLASAQYLAASNIVSILAVAYLLVGLSAIFINTLYAMGRVDETRNANLVGGATNLIFSLLLIPPYGLMGASLAFLFCGFSTCAYGAFKIKRRLNLMFPLKDTARMILASIAFYISAGYAGRFLNWDAAWLAAIAIGCVLYLSVLLLTKFFKETDVRMIGYVKTKFPKSTHCIFDKISGTISHFSN